jgi:2,4-dienoyl-CoA reductase-like NADH-dependent reductase (Old Yellow Enzyme family)/thioredoxin reductase
MTNKFPNITSPITLAGLTLKNRIFSAPISMGLDPNEHFTKENINFFKLRAMGGAALVTIGEGMVDLETGRSHPQQIGLNNPSNLPDLINVVDAIHSGKAAASIELDHGGALSEPDFIPGRKPMGPSGYVNERGIEIAEMTEEEMYYVADKFASAAVNAKSCGFDMVMIHCGHGWLLHQFISPNINHRTDKWGGSLENRMRFPLLVIQKIRMAVGNDFPIEVRISGSERFKGGYDIEEGVEIAKMLDDVVDLIHVSAGTKYDIFSSILMTPGVFQSDMENGYLAAEIKKHVNTPVVTVGAFNIPEDMEKFLAEGHADCIALGRALMADPFLPQKIIDGKPEEITPCLRCMECFHTGILEGVIRCTVNPYIGREAEILHPIPANVRKKVLIAGGGPSGMEAALLAHERGHEVILCEAKEKLGALGYTDKDTDFKIPMRRYRDSQVQKVKALPIDIRLNTRVTKELVNEIKPDTLIAAVGSEPASISVSGAEGENVLQAAYITEESKIGERVVIIGGGLIGCEEAIDLARKGHKVTIVEMFSELATECGFVYKINLMNHMMKEKNIMPATGMQCTRITKEGVYAVDGNNKENFFPADTVVVAIGMHSKSSEVETLRPMVPEFYVIGDAMRARKIRLGVQEAYDAVIALGMM